MIRLHLYNFSWLIPLVAVLFIATLALADATNDLPQAASAVKMPSSRPVAGPTTRSSFDRLPPRPVKSAEEYKKLAEELRAAYLKPAAEWPKPTLDEGVEHRELAVLPKVKFPENNPYTKEKAELGTHLFFDPRLSGSGQIACASCHDPELGWGDGKALSYGHQRQLGKRNAPALFTVAFGASFFWDGRAATLEEQAAQPVLAGEEMAADDLQSIEARIGKIPGYRERFKTVFGSEEVTFDKIGMAIATFERSIVSAYGGSAFDQFLRGKKDALSDEAVRGLHLFRTDARCLNCHNGPLLSDDKFHNLGLSYYGRKLQDLGRHEITNKPEDVGAFKTPTLRNIARTNPYMHNGLFELDGVLNMYNAGMPTLRPRPEQAGDPLFPTKSVHLKSLGFNAHDLADLKAFLESLTERRLRMRPPLLPEAGEAVDAADAETASGSDAPAN